MTVRIPKITEKRCVLFIVCTTISTKDAKIKKIFDSSAAYFSRVKQGKRTFVLSVATDGRSGRHFHVDLADLDYFGPDGAPKQTHSTKDIQNAIQPLVGQTCEVRFEGRFQIPVVELPESIQNYIRLAATSAVVGGVTIRATGGTLHVDGAPISLVRWWISNDKEHVLIELEGRQTVELGESYLEDLWQSICSTYSKLIQGEPADGQVEE